MAVMEMVRMEMVEMKMVEMRIQMKMVEAIAFKHTPADLARLDVFEERIKHSRTLSNQEQEEESIESKIFRNSYQEVNFYSEKGLEASNKGRKNFLWSDIKVPWSNKRPLENKELNAIIGAWFTLWRD
ncbi:hypothetical protein Tco_0493813 [Tanacetum coccineum]